MSYKTSLVYNITKKFNNQKVIKYKKYLIKR